jgi:predicted nucleotidyltransferase
MYKNSISKDNIIDYLRDIKKDFLEKGIEKIALFGSFSKETQSIYSDIDIAIKKDKDFLKKFSPYDYFEIVSELKQTIKNRFGKNVDIFDLDSHSPFLDSIKKELLYV